MELSSPLEKLSWSMTDSDMLYDNRKHKLASSNIVTVFIVCIVFM